MPGALLKAMWWPMAAVKPSPPGAALEITQALATAQNPEAGVGWACQGDGERLSISPGPRQKS